MFLHMSYKSARQLFDSSYFNINSVLFFCFNNFLFFSRKSPSKKNLNLSFFSSSFFFNISFNIYFFSFSFFFSFFISFIFVIFLKSSSYILLILLSSGNIADLIGPNLSLSKIMRVFLYLKPYGISSILLFSFSSLLLISSRLSLSIIFISLFLSLL